MLSIGIVGLANVGKSTLFEALTKKQVNISNYPFCTIDPNVGVVEVPDVRIDKLAQAFNSAKKIPAIVKFVDIAGLVRGANKGEGLGNQFLANIRETDAILFVVRCFENADIIHVEKTVDPVRDIDIVNTELLLKDLETVDKRMQKAEEKDKEFLRNLYSWLEKGNFARSFQERSDLLKELQLLTDKPFVFILNSNTLEISPSLEKKIKELGSEYIIANLRDEYDANKLSEEEKKELGLGESKLGEIIQKSYKTLGLVTFFTTGPDETHAWTIKAGTLAPQASGTIHTDFEKKFICALVINWEKLLNKELPRTEGKEYAVQDGDVIEVKHG